MTVVRIRVPTMRRKHDPVTLSGQARMWTPSIVIAAIVLAVLVLAGVLADWVAPYDPLKTDSSAVFDGPSGAHLIGTDGYGRDVLSRLIHGATTAMGGASITVVIVLLLGIPWGLAAGMLGGIVDATLMRLADALVAIPGLVMAVAIAGAFGPSLRTSMVGLGVVLAPSIAILLRAAVLPLRRADYLLVARSLGVGPVRATVRHVLPNASPPVIVQTCSIASLALIVQGALGFLGLGVQPPEPSWGSDLAAAYNHFTAAPFATVVPGVVLVLAAFSLSRLGDGLRAALRIG